MKNNLLLQLLEKLSSKDQQLLRSYLQSPFFNTTKQSLKLYDCLIVFLKKGVTFDKQDIHRVIFGKTASFNDHKIRLALSELLKLIEDFIYFQKNQKNQIQRNIQLSKFYKGVGLEKHFNRVQRKAKDLIRKEGHQNHAYYLAKNDLEWEQHAWDTTKKRDIKANLQELGQNLDIAYFSSKLRQACFLQNQQVFYNIEYNFQWVQQIIHYILQKNWQDIPAISIYYESYQLVVNPDDTSHFEVLKQKIIAYSHLFPAEEIRNIYILAINYCIKKVNNGQRNYVAESLKLYKMGLKVGCFLEQGMLSKFTYANIVAFGLIAKDFEWTETFLLEYKNKLKKEVRKSSFAFNMARLVYVKNKNYEAALQHLQQVSDKDLLNTLNAKILQLKIYFELKELKLLNAHLEAMANFIRRKEVIGYHKANYLNIIKFTKHLLKVNFYDRAAIEKLKNKIETEQIISEKKWILKQLDRL